MLKLQLLNLLNFMFAPLKIVIIPIRFNSKTMRLIQRMAFPRFDKNDNNYKKQMTGHIGNWKEKISRKRMPTSMWTVINQKKEINLPHFRSDNKYIYQTRDNNTPDSAVLTYKYIKNKDRLNILSLSKETGDFGAEVVQIPTYGLVSRDLVDSVTELNFLENKIGMSKIENLTIFDIGAGYGRLALHSIINLGNIKKYICLDAVEESLGLCEFYLKYKNIDPEKYQVTTLPERFTPPEKSIAVAIHSFSEMPINSIVSWVGFLQKMGTSWLFIVPNRESHNGQNLLSTEKDGARIDYSKLFPKYGFERYGIFPKYDDPDLQKYGISPTMYHLYKKKEKAERSK